jgi:hypothetical protein
LMTSMKSWISLPAGNRKKWLGRPHTARNPFR